MGDRRLTVGGRATGDGGRGMGDGRKPKARNWKPKEWSVDARSEVDSRTLRLFDARRPPAGARRQSPSRESPNVCPPSRPESATAHRMHVSGLVSRPAL